MARVGVPGERPVLLAASKCLHALVALPRDLGSVSGVGIQGFEEKRLQACGEDKSCKQKLLAPKTRSRTATDSKVSPLRFWSELVVPGTNRYQDRWKWFLPASRSFLNPPGPLGKAKNLS